MSAYSRNYFKDRYVEKGDTVYVLFCSIAIYQNRHTPTTSYRIVPYIVTAVGRRFLTAKPKDGTGKPVKFEPTLEIMPGYGLYLIRKDSPGVWTERLFPSLRLAETYKKILESRIPGKGSEG